MGIKAIEVKVTYSSRRKFQFISVQTDVSLRDSNTDSAVVTPSSYPAIDIAFLDPIVDTGVSRYLPPPSELVRFIFLYCRFRCGLPGRDQHHKVDTRSLGITRTFEVGIGFVWAVRSALPGNATFSISVPGR